MENTDSGDKPLNRSFSGGNILGGLVIIAAGTMLLMRSMGVPLPYWLFSWQMFLITLGVFFLAKNAFRKPSGLILILIGSFFLVEELIPSLSIGAYFWPLLIIFIGLTYMFGRGRCDNSCRNRRDKRRHTYGRFSEPFSGSGSNYPEQDLQANDQDAYLGTTTIFGATKKKVISKQFKGGEITTIFGGAEIDLSQAEIEQPVVLEITQVFGGTQLVIPNHWTLRPELVTVIGGTDDKRERSSVPNDPTKILTLKGTVAFGGIEIVSYPA